MTDVLVDTDKLPPNMYVFERSGVHLLSSGQTSAVWEMRSHRMSRGGAGESGRSLLVAGSAGAATGSGFGIGGAAGRRFLGGLVTGAASGAAGRRRSMNSAAPAKQILQSHN